MTTKPPRRVRGERGNVVIVASGPHVSPASPRPSMSLTTASGSMVSGSILIWDRLGHVDLAGLGVGDPAEA